MPAGRERMSAASAGDARTPGNKGRSKKAAALTPCGGLLRVDETVTCLQSSTKYKVGDHA
jgi:hypothetical protein